ncbi:MAG: nitroreductase family deazaflavin-dependent oxidoreductase [Anaerolineales bacterium]|uniref:nitroreductase/quinone reductase family protein n=1 Tax=Candidatus Villigracilis proximus TaxID=3140683 RepID=UPI003134DFA5|nr:nitroreductase family deazaflavin-dependent oxidoreductase [Anaerolineales bacterium]
MIEITTIGAKSGGPRTMPLVSLIDGEKIALIGSNFGQKNSPGWYYNLKRTRNAVNLNGRAGEYSCRETQGEEREKYWQMAVSVYKWVRAIQDRAAHHGFGDDFGTNKIIVKMRIS